MATTMTTAGREVEFDEGCYREGRTYWNSSGKYQLAGDALKALVPVMGSVDQPKKNRLLEKFRKASNCYYDLYNNGLGNRAGEFARVFGITSSCFKRRLSQYGCTFDTYMFDMTEGVMNTIIAEAAAEQGIALATGKPIKPKTAWCPTGKVGKSLMTGEATAEYGEVDADGRWTGNRMWVSVHAGSTVEVNS